MDALGGEGPLVSNEKSLTLATGNYQTLFTKTYCLAGNTIDREPQNGGNGKGYQEKVSYTLNTMDRHAVAKVYRQDAYDKFSEGDKASTLKAAGGSYGGAVRTSYRRDVKTVGALLHRDYKGVGNQDLPKCDKLIVER